MSVKCALLLANLNKTSEVSTSKNKTSGRDERTTFGSICSHRLLSRETQLMNDNAIAVLALHATLMLSLFFPVS